MVNKSDKCKAKGLSLPASLMAKLIKIAEERRQPFSWVVRDAIEFFLVSYVSKEENIIQGEKSDE